MAGENSYPKLSVTNWWALRKKFQSNPNIKITPGFLAMHFEMGEDSARTNVIPPLRAIGFIDDDGKPTDLAYDWRDDERYAEVCAAIRRTVYPQELNDAVIDPADRVKVENWFKHKARVGEASARKMAAFYLMLCEATVPGELRTNKPAAEAKDRDKNRPTRPLQPTLFAQEPPPAAEKNGAPTSHISHQPTFQATVPAVAQPLQVVIQIQISPECTPEQIDGVFASLVRNLKLLQG
ncbi:MAG: DUF5343 domain-containing protein [Cytophagales bacterium]|jgi:hypothetical protein|nr:DUF5343 domain-containing protein [Cytophagales bacterium]